MKLIIIRHADPDYSIDSLTEKGWKEAELLSHRISKLDVKAFYCSPLGRAKDTASLTLEKMGRTAETCDWLKEFYYCQIHLPYIPADQTALTWDLLPGFFTKIDDIYDHEKFQHLDFMEEGKMPELYRGVKDGIDGLLAKHGYEREGRYYRAVAPNTDTIVLFCHFGVECFILGHILGISPVIMAQAFVAAPSSVTTLYTEEREEGIACFRCGAFGDISHLYAGNEEPSFAARFCETYSNFDERH